MTRTVALMLVTAALLLVPAAAEAKRAPMSFGLAATIAADYWAKRGVTIPCQPRRVMLTHTEADALDAAFGFGVTMVAWHDRCLVGISPTGEFYRTDRVSQLKWLYCTDVVHEIGHIAGLTHGYGGVMAPTLDGLPWGCAHPRRFRRLMSATRDGWASQASPRTGPSRTVAR